MSTTDQGTGDQAAPTGPVAGTAARRAKREAERGTRAPASAGRTATTTDRLPAGDDDRRVRQAERARRRRLDPDKLAALEEERDFLLRSLEDLEREHAAGDVDDDDFETLRDDYTVRAADVLRAIEGRRSAMAANRAPRSNGRTVLIGVGVLLFAVVLGVAMSQAAGRRGSSDTISGGVRSSSRDVFLEAQDLMGQQQYLEAIKKFDEAIALDPGYAEAHQWKGWMLRLSAGGTRVATDQQLLLNRAHESLTTAIELDPELDTAYLFRASVNNDLRRPAEGLADLERVRPGSIPPGLVTLQERLRGELQAQAGGAAPSSTIPTGGSPASTTPSTTTP